MNAFDAIVAGVVIDDPFARLERQRNDATTLRDVYLGMITRAEDQIAAYRAAIEDLEERWDLS
jgi:hypothetical protein